MTEEQIEKVDSSKIEAQILAQVTDENTKPALQNADSFQNDEQNVLNSKGGSVSKASFGDILKGYTKRKKLGDDSLEESESQDNKGVEVEAVEVKAEAEDENNEENENAKAEKSNMQSSSIDKAEIDSGDEPSGANKDSESK